MVTIQNGLTNHSLWIPKNVLVASGSRTGVTCFSFDDSECSDFDTAVGVNFSIKKCP